MMNINQKPEVNQDMKMIPVKNYGVKYMSMGLLVEKDAPIVWRGPMMTRAVYQENLDVLVVDMPPGTGDTQITISQNLKLLGDVIVSTPQDVALADAIVESPCSTKLEYIVSVLVCCGHYLYHLDCERAFEDAAT